MLIFLSPSARSEEYPLKGHEKSLRPVNIETENKTASTKLPATKDDNYSLADAEKLFHLGKVEEAKRAVSAFLADAEGENAYISVGSLFARLRRWPDSVHYLEIATNRNSKNAFAWYALGLAQHQNKNVDDAVASLRKSVSISSTTPKSILALGTILELAQDRYDARQVYQTGITKLGPRADIFARLCWLNYQDSYFADTIKLCTLATNNDAHDVTSWAILGRALYDSQKRKEAFEVLKSTIANHPKEGITYRARGLIYFQEKSYEQAVYDLGKAFGRNPDDDEAGIHLARALFELKNYEQALPIYFETVKLNREYRFEFLSKQRELTQKNKDELAARYQESYEKL